MAMIIAARRIHGLHGAVCQLLIGFLLTSQPGAGIDVVISSGAGALRTDRTAASHRQLLRSDDSLARRLNSLPPPLHEDLPDKFVQSYALNDKVLDSGRISGNVERMGSLLKRAKAGEQLRVVVFGGSFTRGHGCSQDVEPEIECSWPHRLEKWWRRSFPSSHLLWENRAEHGRSSRELLASLSANLLDSTVPDLIIVDLLVNDAGQEGAWIAHEKLLRSLKQLAPNAQLLLVFGASPDAVKDASQYRQLAAHYNIPAVDYAMMVSKYNKDASGHGPDRLWPSSSPDLHGGIFTVTGDAWPDFAPQVQVTAPTCCPENHPPWPVHQYFADAVVDSLSNMADDHYKAAAAVRDDAIVTHTMPSPIASSADLALYPVCLQPLTQYSALTALRRGFEQGEAAPIVMSGNWKLFEDRADRPGWIATESGSRIRFPVRFGVEPTLTITYLRSYKGVGDADLKLYDSEHHKARHSVLLTGAWDEPYSMPVPSFFVARPDSQMGDILDGVITQEEKETLRNLQVANTKEANFTDLQAAITRERVLEFVTLGDEKFKIVGITSC